MGDVCTKEDNDWRVGGHRHNQDEVLGANNNRIRDEFRTRSDVERGSETRGLWSLLEGEWDVPNKRGRSGDGGQVRGSIVPTECTG